MRICALTRVVAEGHGTKSSNHFHTCLQQHNSHSPHSQSSVTALVPMYKLFYLIPHCHRERWFLLQLHFHKPTTENWFGTFSSHRKSRNLGSKTNAISLSSWNTSFVQPQVNPTALYSGTAYTQHANRNLRLYKPQGERSSQIWGRSPIDAAETGRHIWQWHCIHRNLGAYKASCRRFSFFFLLAILCRQQQ